MQDRIGDSLKDIALTQRALNLKKHVYQPLTRRCTKLFFLVSEMYKLNPMY